MQNFGNVYGSFNEMAAGTGVLAQPTSQMSVFNAEGDFVNGWEIVEENGKFVVTMPTHVYRPEGPPGYGIPYLSFKTREEAVQYAESRASAQDTRAADLAKEPYEDEIGRQFPTPRR